MAEKNSEIRNKGLSETNGVSYFDFGVIEGSDGKKYQRFAIKTHFVEVGESNVELIKRYVAPIYQEGDVCAFGAKVMAMCTKNVVKKEDVKPGFFAKLLAPFASINSTGVGVHEPLKMQLVIDICGLPKVLFAAFVSAVTRPFGVHGLFYKICGHDVGGIDGFYYRSSFDLYKELALLNNENGDELCDEVSKATNIPIVLSDANDIDQNIIGICANSPLTITQIQEAIKDNPAGQEDELTPLILIRPIN